MSDNKKDLRSLSYEECLELAIDLGDKKFRGQQIFSWLHDKKVNSIDDMTNLSKNFREKLNEQYSIYEVMPVKILVSEIDGTRKYIHRLSDGNVIESVLLKYEYGNTVCISSQVGCAMGCRFCASTIDGLVRNLTAGEMAGQIYSIERDIQERVGHVVIMGSGEPLDNFDEFTKFINIITSDKGANLSNRNITASTCGIAPNIKRLADMKTGITLALSLHAVTDEKRKQIMPITYKYSLDEVLSACKYFFEVTGRRITLEYSLIAGENDNPSDVDGLIKIANMLKSHVNLIPVNPVKERDYKASSKKAVDEMRRKLERNHVNATVRREMGRDINGACGQLRRSYIEEN